MRALALVLVAAACGGSPSAPSSPRSTGATSGEEDWRAHLGQLAGGACRWIPGASLLYCPLPGEPVTPLFIGWEPLNRRYVLWLVSPDGTVRVLPGTAGASEWSFTDNDLQVTLTRDAAGWKLDGRKAGGGAQMAAMLETSAPVVPAPATRGAYGDKEDWRSALEQLATLWEVDETVNGQAVTLRKDCRWITGATFILCHEKDVPVFSMFGYEPHNHRYAHYTFSPAGEPRALAGTVTNGTWSVADATLRLTLTRSSPIEYGLRIEQREGQGPWSVLVEGTYRTTPGGME